MRTALTIAGSDPTGGAGLQVDLRTFKSLGVYGLSVPTVMTVQNTEGVFNIHELPVDFFSRQMDALLNDVLPDALKTGMVYSSGIIEIIVERIKGYALKNIVIDPVTVSSSGRSLVSEGALDTMKQHLFPIARVITPNIYEASLFTGVDIHGEEDMKTAAEILLGLGPSSVIITGGHLEGGAIDVFFDGSEFIILQKDILDGKYHGTGCVFSAVITACLALGYDVKEAFIRAKEFVYDAMTSAITIGKGMKILNF